MGALVRLAFRDFPRRRDGVGVGGEPHGCDGGEPADGAGVVVVVEGGDPAVPLQFDREIRGCPLDAGERGAQGAAQQFGEPDAECGGRGAGETPGRFGREDDLGLLGRSTAGRSAGAWRVVSQWSRPSTARAVWRVRASAYSA
ncbi:hypothetical protein SHKM778_43630 [Streptomyces sp. KM77-8]|uniref:Uncharacterized protein n=1 Tax=Streptomyces haneummycinicus TaxID=3074435 RepID=A0AAT9HKU5_9ACTN